MGKESLDSCPRLKLTEINPFTPRQRDVIRLIVAGQSPKDISRSLNLSHQYIKNIISCFDGESIYERVEKFTGKRPRELSDLIATLAGDVLILVRDHKNPCLPR